MLKRSKWEGYRFSSGSQTGQDYLNFQKDARTDLRKMVKEEGLKLYSFNKNHYCFSCVISDEEEKKFIYVSQSDVRPNLTNSILIRTMKGPKDWTGGHNNFCKWEEVGKYAKNLMRFIK